MTGDINRAALVESALENVSDEELSREVRRRERLREEAAERERLRVIYERRDRTRREDTEFAGKFGLTYDQYEEIAEHVRERWKHEDE
jgi:hypothetical protein